MHFSTSVESTHSENFVHKQLQQAPRYLREIRSVTWNQRAILPLIQRNCYQEPSQRGCGAGIPTDGRKYARKFWNEARKTNHLLRSSFHHCGDGTEGNAKDWCGDGVRDQRRVPQQRCKSRFLNISGAGTSHTKRNQT